MLCTTMGWKFDFRMQRVMQSYWRSLCCHSMCNSTCSNERLGRVCIPVIDLHCVVSAGRCHNVFTAWAEVYGCDSTLYQPTSTSDRR